MKELKGKGDKLVENWAEGICQIQLDYVEMSLFTLNCLNLLPDHS